MEFILGFALLVLAIALGVRLGVPKSDKRHYQSEEYIYRLREMGILTKDEYSKVCCEYHQQSNHPKLRETLLELKRLGFLTDAELEEKQTLLDRHYMK